MQVTVYNTTTGAVLRSLEVYDPADAPLQAGAGEAWLEGRVDPLRERVSNGKIVRKDAAVIDALEKEQAEFDLRRERNQRLRNTDWTQLPDSGRNRRAWAQYRQELRDLPANTPDPRSPIWPKKPDE